MVYELSGKSWRERLQIDGWSSEYKSVNKLLGHLSRKTRSLSSLRGYCGTLDRLCRKVGKNPDDLLEMNAEKLEEKIMKFLDRYSKSSGTVNAYKYNILTFLRVNEHNIELPQFYRPSRGGKVRHEYVPSLKEAQKMVECAGSLKARAIVSTLYGTGLRNSTPRALKYGKGSPEPMFKKYTIKKELERGRKNLAIVVYPEMKKNVPEACKNKIPYYVFTPEQVTEALRDYLSERGRKQGKISKDEFLFPSDNKRISEGKRKFTSISGREVREIVKNAARRANIEEWEHISPHCLRKTFKSILRDQCPENRLDHEDQVFFFSHIQERSEEAYYDPSKVERMREKFPRLSFEPEPSLNKQVLKMFSKLYGADYNSLISEIKRRSNGEVNYDCALEVLREQIEERKKQKIVSKDKLQGYLDSGWEYVNNISKEEVLVQRRRPVIGLDGKNDQASLSSSFKMEERETGDGPQAHLLPSETSWKANRGEIGTIEKEGISRGCIRKSSTSSLAKQAKIEEFEGELSEHANSEMPKHEGFKEKCLTNKLQLQRQLNDEKWLRKSRRKWRDRKKRRKMIQETLA